MDTELHPDVARLEFLLGTWSGQGRGIYPTIDPFTYTEEATYTSIGKPFLRYAQRTRGADGLPLHAEDGYLRPAGDHSVELVLAHPFGVTEVQVGVAEPGRIALRSTAVGLAPTAKDIRTVTRTIEVDGDEMHYVIEMAAVGQPLQVHLEARLSRRA